jgi:tetratricopeptide (TPR) repeat protein
MWSPSTHARAGGAPHDVSLLASFDGSPIHFRDAVVTPTRRGARWVFVVRQEGRIEREFAVDGVVGGGFMYGGGTQGFVTRRPDGTLRLLPFELIRSEGVWFCNTASRANAGWIPITPQLALADCGDWPPSRVLGDAVSQLNCQACHGSQIEVALDPSWGGYRTTWTSLGINCESCHGPGRPHLDALEDPERRARGDLAITPLATLDKDASLGVCWQCHALKYRLRSGWLPGRRFDDYYSLHLAQLGDAAPFGPDGRVRIAAYQQSHLLSDCYVSGGMTCTSCHDPHRQTYRDPLGRPLVGRFDDRQCTGCHASKADAPQSHTHHPAASDGSRCTSCHMPYRQEAAVGATLRYARSNHAIPVPRPAADSASGITSACRSCHTDRSESDLDAQVRVWYGRLKPLNPAIASVLSWREGDALETAARKLILPGAAHTAAVAAGLTRFVERYAAASRSAVDREAHRRLELLTRHPDLDVRALALASLHLLWGERPDTRRLLAGALDSAGADGHLLRARWSAVLSWRADGMSGDPRGALATYRKALEVQPSDARLHFNVALALGRNGQTAEASAAYRESLRLDPMQPLALVNLGLALTQLRDTSGAIEAYQRALTLNPHEALAHFNLGNVHLQQRNVARAEESYRRAVEADGSLALAHWYLARLLFQRGDLKDALREVDATLEFDRHNPAVRAAREELIQRGAAR